MQSIVFPQSAFDESRYIVNIDENSSTVNYFGWALIGSSNSEAVWKIKKMVKTGNVTSILFADGNKEFDNIWNNRESLSYS